MLTCNKVVGTREFLTELFSLKAGYYTMEGKVDEDTTKVEFTVEGKPVYTYIQHTTARKMWHT